MHSAQAGSKRLSPSPGLLPAAAPFQRVIACLLAGLSCLAPPRTAPAAVEPAPADYSEAIRQVQELAATLVRQGEISGVCIALVEDQRLIHAQGYGWADKRRRVPATADTVCRAGSISKLFTALATLQLAEQGRLQIDQPVTNYVPAFAGVINPFPEAGAVTLRQLMCHRSGMLRESPVGSYFDDSEPGTARTVASLDGCVLVYPPGSQTKYSNSGVTVVGQAVALVAGVPFEIYQRAHLFGPLGMVSSDFLLGRRIRPRLARGYLPVAQRGGGFKEIDVPHFELGTIPAGNLYTTARDLARFLSCLFAQGRVGQTSLVQPETLEQMFTPQLTTNTAGFGLGFSIGEFRGHKTFNHSGAVYGFSSLLAGLPGPKLGVVVLCNDDLAFGPVRRLNQVALEQLLQARLGQAPPPAKPTHARTLLQLADYAGDYESESWWATLRAGDLLQANIGGQRLSLRPVAPLQFEGSGRIAFETPFEFKQDETGKITGFSALGRTFRRVDPAATPPPPVHWKEFLGEYGPAFIPVIISIKHGHLYAMTENEYDNRLSPVTRTIFKMPPGLYTDEYLVFEQDKRGRVRGLTLANMYLQRRRP